MKEKSNKIDIKKFVLSALIIVMTTFFTLNTFQSFAYGFQQPIARSCFEVRTTGTALVFASPTATSNHTTLNGGVLLTPMGQPTQNSRSFFGWSSNTGHHSGWIPNSQWLSVHHC